MPVVRTRPGTETARTRIRVGRSAGEVRADIRWAVGRALVLAVTFGLFAFLVNSLYGGEAFEAHLHATPGQVLATYLASALVGGLLIGLLRPVFRHWWGAAIGGFVGGAILALSMVALDMLRGQWKSSHWIIVPIYAATVGVAVGLAWFKRFSSGKDRDAGGQKPTRQQRRHRDSGSGDTE
jgi:multisubunit Na+/H+ antiporter MnhB subunit